MRFYYLDQTIYVGMIHVYTSTVSADDFKPNIDQWNKIRTKELANDGEDE